MLCGLIWRENAKDKRSMKPSREEKNILPAHTGNTSSTFRASLFGGRAKSSVGDGETGYGFGRQAEKNAGLRGMFLILFVFKAAPLLWLRRFHPPGSPGVPSSLRVAPRQPQQPREHEEVACALACAAV
jgi:hypothetical protein